MTDLIVVPQTNQWHRLKSLVLDTEQWPSVACTKWMGAPVQGMGSQTAAFLKCVSSASRAPGVAPHAELRVGATRRPCRCASRARTRGVHAVRSLNPPDWALRPATRESHSPGGP